MTHLLVHYAFLYPITGADPAIMRGGFLRRLLQSQIGYIGYYQTHHGRTKTNAG